MASEYKLPYTANEIEEILAGGGSGSEYEKIIDYTIEEDVNLLCVDTDLKGNTFELKEAIMFLALYRTDAEDGTAQQLALMFGTDKKDGNLFNYRWQSCENLIIRAQDATTQPKCLLARYKKIENGLVIFEPIAITNDGYSNNHWLYGQTMSVRGQRGARDSVDVYGIPNINSIVLYAGNSKAFIAAGSRIVLWGVRE